VLLEVLKNNKLYVFLAVFLIFMSVLSFLSERTFVEEETNSVVIAGQAKDQTSFSMFEDEDISAREEKIHQLAKDNPALFFFVGILNLTVLFLVFAGCLLDIYLIVRVLRKQPLAIRSNLPDVSRWTVGDIFRVILLFMSFGYVFIIVQAFVAGFFPILYNENFRMIFNTAAANIIGISIIMHFVIKKYSHKISDLGITAKDIFKNIFIAISGYLALLPVLIAIMVVTLFVVRFLKYHPPVQPIVKLFMEEKVTGILWMSALFAAVFGPIAEEIFFRGFMYPAVKRKLGAVSALMITSIIFAGLHAHLVGFMPIMALGILLGYLYEKTGSLVSSISVHIFHNVAMLGLVFLARGLGL